MTNKEIAKLAGVGERTVARFKKKPGWPGDSDPSALVEWIHANKARTGRKAKGEGVTETKAQAAETYKLNIAYKQSQIEKNNTATHGYQQRIIKEYRHKMVKGCLESIDIIFKAIKKMDLDNDQIKTIKKAAESAKQHLKGVFSD